MGIPTSVFLAFVVHMGGKVGLLQSSCCYCSFVSNAVCVGRWGVYKIMIDIYNCDEQGLWIGIICALLVQDMLYGFILIFTNWEKEVSFSAGLTLSSFE